MSQADSAGQLDILTQINLDDLQSSLGWNNWRAGRGLVRLLFEGPARRFAMQMVAFDQGVGRLGLCEGARRILPIYSRGLKVSGQENVLPAGPLLVLSNHPGMADSLALFASLPRDDLHIIGIDRPFLRSLSAASDRMIYLPEAPGRRLEAVRQTIRALRAGEVVLTYPAGQIEPDPAVLPGAVEALEGWSDSIGFFALAVPSLAIVGAVVSHVLAPQATFHPLTHLRRKHKEREALGASIQLIANVLFPNLWPVEVELSYTPALLAADLVQMGDAKAITRAVVSHIRPYVAAAVKAKG